LEGEQYCAARPESDRAIFREVVGDMSSSMAPPELRSDSTDRFAGGERRVDGEPVPM
jgi:hypothetical protein